MMVTVSMLSKEDSLICPDLASMLCFFQIHEVKRVTAHSSPTWEVLFHSPSIFAVGEGSGLVY